MEDEHVESVLSDHTAAQFFRGAVIDEVVTGYQYNTSGDWVPLTFHHDNLTSVTGLSGHEGRVLHQASYGPFGDVISSVGASCNFLQYTGRERDADSGLYYYRARYYDPSIGRFLTEDPLGFAAGINFYAYVDNNPINANDPTGHLTFTVGVEGHERSTLASCTSFTLTSDSIFFHQKPYLFS